jgi:hypothetical protein
MYSTFTSLFVHEPRKESHGSDAATQIVGTASTGEKRISDNVDLLIVSF